MNVQSLARRTMLILALGALLVPLTGCNKMLANFSLSQANKRVEQAKKFKADEHLPNELSRTQDAIQATSTFISQQQFKDARIKGKEAATLAKDLLAQTKERQAAALKTLANSWKGYLDLNEAQREGPDMYQQITKTNDDGIKAFEKQSWEKAIVAFDKAISDAQYLLQNLKTQADGGLKDVQAKLEELKAEGAEENRPEAVSEAEDSIKQITSLINEKYNYREALRMKDVAIQKGDEGIRKTREVKSDKLLREVQTSLNKATQLGAELYAPESFNSVSGNFEDLLRLHYEGNYESVLKSGPALIPKAKDLIVETQRESARSRLAAVDKAITKLVDGKAKIHLPGRVEKMEGLYKAAKEKFDLGSAEQPELYTETETICNTALEEEQSVLAEYDSLAQKRVAEAKDQLSTAKAIFEKMVDIFSRPSPVPLSGDDEMFEKQKEALREEIGGRRTGAELQLAKTDLMRGDKNFAGMIEIAEKTMQDSAQIVNDTFKVVSFNTINELANEMTVYERDGGREYTPESLSKAEAMLIQTREIHKSGDYRQALTQASETKAQIEILAQDLHRVTASKLQDVDKAIETAKSWKGELYKGDALIQAAGAREAAAQSFSAGSNKEAIKTAEKAKEIADDAAKSAIRQWSEDEMRRTDLMLARAREAGAEFYAPAQLDEALDLRKTAQSLHDAGDYDKAQTTGAKAASEAERALYAMVIKAEDEIAQAKRFDAWRYENERLAQSIITAKNAREFLDRGDYPEARIHAKHSFETASAVVIDAKRASFNDRLVSLNSKVEAAASQGAGYYQIKDLSAIVGELNRLATEFSPAGYEDAAQKIELLEAQLAGLVEMTPNVLQELVDHLNRTLAELEGRGAKVEQPDLVAAATQRIKYAQLDYKAERYRPSFQNAKDAIKLLNEIDLKLDERDYDLALSKLFTDFSRSMERFAPVLNMGSPILMHLTKGPTGRAQAVALLSASSPTDFRQELTDMIAQVTLLEPPATRAIAQEEAVKMFEQAKEAAGGFEKLLILDQYDEQTGMKIIEKAYLGMRAARQRQQDIQASLESPQTRTEQPGVRRAIVQTP